MSHVCVIVLGDTGRSPRMQYHAHSFAQLDEVERVSIVGYTGEACISSVRDHRKITDIRINPYEVNWLKKIPLLHALAKGMSVVLTILFTLICLPAYDTILIQNPPALPALLGALLADLLPWRSSHIILDWHNLGFAMFEERLGSKHILVFLSRFLEKLLAQFVTRHICVSKAMSEWLSTHFSIQATVLYDRPAASFKRAGSSLAQKHDLFMRLQLTPAVLFHSTTTTTSTTKDTGNKGTGTSAKVITYSFDGNLHSPTSTSNPTTKTIQTCQRKGCEIETCDDDDFIPVLVSSTSWTPDEDFSLLINALLTVESTLASNNRDTILMHMKSIQGNGKDKDRERESPLPEMRSPGTETKAIPKRAVVCVTGKGPLKSEFESKIAMLITEGKLGKYIAVRTLWLEAEDYPVFMGCCAMGISLHTSTSGLDLPMKVLDMFGSGLPVCAVHFPTLPELVQHNYNGLIFGDPSTFGGDIDTASPRGNGNGNNSSSRRSSSSKENGSIANISELKAIAKAKRKQFEQLAMQLLHCIFDVRPQLPLSMDYDENDDEGTEDGRTLLNRLRCNASNITSWDQNWLSVMPQVLLSINTMKITDSFTSKYFWWKQVCRGICWAVMCKLLMIAYKVYLSASA